MVWGMTMDANSLTLVTGGGGFLGGRIVEAVLGRGGRVRIFGRSRYSRWEGRPGVECQVGDLCDLAAVRIACRGCGLVVHTAAKAGVWGSRREFFETNLDGTRHVVEGCVQEDVPRLVFTSSPSVVFGNRPIEGGDESLPYPKRYLAAYPESKAAAERLVLAADGRLLGHGRSHLRTCALRPHLIWGVGDPHLLPRIAAAAKAGRLRQVGNGRNLVDLTHVEHAAQAHLLAALALAREDSPVAGHAYFLGDREPVSLWPWLRGLLGRLGLRIPARAVPYRVAHLTGGALELLYRCVPGLGEPRMTRFVAAQLAMSHWFSHAAAERDFGYRPVRDPAADLEAAADWLRASLERPEAGA